MELAGERIFLNRSIFSKTWSCGHKQLHFVAREKQMTYFRIIVLTGCWHNTTSSLSDANMSSVFIIWLHNVVTCRHISHHNNKLVG